MKKRYGTYCFWIGYFLHWVGDKLFRQAELSLRAMA